MQRYWGLEVKLIFFWGVVQPAQIGSVSLLHFTGSRRPQKHQGCTGHLEKRWQPLRLKLDIFSGRCQTRRPQTNRACPSSRGVGGGASAGHAADEVCHLSSLVLQPTLRHCHRAPVGRQARPGLSRAPHVGALNKGTRVSAGPSVLRWEGLGAESVCPRRWGWWEETR